MSQYPANVKINVNILPFGHAAAIMRSSGSVPQKEQSFPRYCEPKTTDLKLMEITFNGNNYITPKSTGGIF